MPPARLTQLLKLHAVDPADADLCYMIAIEHDKAAHTTEAIGWLDKTLALDTHYHYAYFQKGRMLNQAGQTPAAIQAVKQGITTATEAGDTKAQSELTELLTDLST